MSNARGKLGEFLREIIDWNWREFCIAERDPKYTGYQASVFALVRACADAELSAIKLSIDRVDGKIVTPVKYEFPKIYVRYPLATSVATSPEGGTGLLADPDPIKEAAEPEVEDDVPLVTMTLRETLEKMADSPRQVPLFVHDQKKEVEERVRNHAEFEEDEHIVLVKSVIAANLLILANEKGDFDAITEVFDRIDGKLVEVIKFLGGDIYIDNYSLEAPADAVQDKDGIWQAEMPQVTDMWRTKLEK